MFFYITRVGKRDAKWFVLLERESAVTVRAVETSKATRSFGDVSALLNESKASK